MGPSAYSASTTATMDSGPHSSSSSALALTFAPLMILNAPAGDSAGRRSKQVEKAKMQMLTRQLAMRLQYARLKVDHGWAHQNLNEVENLYFHHYRSRIHNKAVAAAPSSSSAGADNSNLPPAASPNPNTPRDTVSATVNGDPSHIHHPAPSTPPGPTSHFPTSTTTTNIHNNVPSIQVESASSSPHPLSSTFSKPNTSSMFPPMYTPSPSGSGAATANCSPTGPSKSPLPQTSAVPSTSRLSYSPKAQTTAKNPPIRPRPYPPIAPLPASQTSPTSSRASLATSSALTASGVLQHHRGSKPNVLSPTSKSSSLTSHSSKPSNTSSIFPLPSPSKSSGATNTAKSTSQQTESRVAYKPPDMLPMSPPKGPASYESFWSSMKGSVISGGGMSGQSSPMTFAPLWGASASQELAPTSSHASSPRKDSLPGSGPGPLSSTELTSGAGSQASPSIMGMNMTMPTPAPYSDHMSGLLNGAFVDGHQDPPSTGMNPFAPLGSFGDAPQHHFGFYGLGMQPFPSSSNGQPQLGMPYDAHPNGFSTAGSSNQGANPLMPPMFGTFTGIPGSSFSDPSGMFANGDVALQPTTGKQPLFKPSDNPLVYSTGALAPETNSSILEVNSRPINGHDRPSPSNVAGNNS